jgi:N-methylhydantoinase A/oxoprolinase/acetone carboxylase beta subunit
MRCWSAPANTLLVTTHTLQDALRIAYQRPRLFDRHIVCRSCTARGERKNVSAQGDVLQALDELLLKGDQAILAGARGVRCFMHGYRFTDNEKPHSVLHAGFTQISTSHETSPMMVVAGATPAVVDIPPVAIRGATWSRWLGTARCEAVFMQSVRRADATRVFRARTRS